MPTIAPITAATAKPITIHFIISLIYFVAFALLNYFPANDTLYYPQKIMQYRADFNISVLNADASL
jgi:hypothetical protein